MTTNEKVLEKTIQRCRERNVVIPTFAQLKNPDTIPQKIKNGLPKVGMWDVNPVNLFRITWKNDIHNKLFGKVNYIEFPSALTGVPVRIIGLIGKYFPTGAHKVGAAFGCLVPKLVTGQFDPTTQKAVWPSTGNYCRGGAFDSALLNCTAVAILPEQMSKERFEWLKTIGAEVIATPGCESNVKEIYDKCWEIKRTRHDCMIFNQFEEFGNCIWHHEVTGSAIEEVFREIARPGSRLSAYISATGSAGTIGAGEYLKKKFPGVKIAASEAKQCPTLLLNGFGAHQIEGIGDKHVPWIHNVRNTDVVVSVDDEQCMSLLRLFNEPEGISYLSSLGLSQDFLKQLPLVGISGICNLVSCIKTAKYFEMNGNDILFTILTDSTELYKSRIQEQKEAKGTYNQTKAAIAHERYLLGTEIDFMQELGYYDRKRLHNLKYFTWVEQQGKEISELHELWNPEFWDKTFAQATEWDKKIEEFNKRTGLL